MPGAQCTRSLVCAIGSEVCTPVFTAEAPDTSGIPHAMVLRLIRALPGDEFLLPPSAHELNGISSPGWADDASASLSISNGCQDHTTSPYASAPFVFARLPIAHRLITRPAIPFRATLSRPPHPASRFVTKRP
jgi:hypothetical protein